MIALFCGIGIWIIYILSNKKVKYPDFVEWIILWGFTFSLAGIAYKANPLWDLSQHFSYMEKIQEAKISLEELCRTGIEPYEHNRSYWLFNVLCYAAVKIDNFHLVPFIMVLADYLICTYITFDYQKSHSIYQKEYFLSVFICFSVMPFVHAVAGMRNANAACLVALAVYLYLEKCRIFFYSLVLIILALLMHPSVMLVLPALIFAKRKLTYKIFMIIGIVITLIPVTARFFNTLPILFLNRIGHLYLFFSSPEQYINSRRYLYVDILIVCLYLIVALINWRLRKCSREYLNNFFILYLLCILGNLGNYDLIIRPMYVIAPLALPFTHMIFSEKWFVTKKQDEYFKMTICGILSGLCIWCIKDYIIIFITYF